MKNREGNGTGPELNRRKQSSQRISTPLFALFPPVQTTPSPDSTVQKSNLYHYPAGCLALNVAMFYEPDGCLFLRSVRMHAEAAVPTKKYTMPWIAIVAVRI